MPADAPTPTVGLTGLRAHLDRVVQRHGLRTLTVVIDDPDLGRQAFRAGSGPGTTGAIAAGPGVTTDPPISPDVLDRDLLLATCALSLRLELLGESSAHGDPDELALRRLPGVYAVVLERDGDLTLCHVFATADAPEDVARRAAEALAPTTGARVVVELRRDPIVASAPSAQPTAASVAPTAVAPTAPVAAPEPTPGFATRTPAPYGGPLDERFADATWSEDALASRTAPASFETRVPETPVVVHPTPPTLLSVRSVPEDGEIEVHLAIAGTRSVGRALLSRGLAGASEAVLAAARQLDAALAGWMPSWVRTVETTADGQFVVAASLSEPSGGQRHGIAAGVSPIEGAARATALAIADHTSAT